MTDFDEDTPRLPVADLKRLAGYQRWVIACVLAQITMWLGILVMSIVDGGWIDTDVPKFLTWIFGIGGGIYAFLIYWTLRNPFFALVMGLASVIPFLGLLTLTVVNGAASRILNRNGVQVGLFGADLNEIQERAFEFEDGDDPGW